MMSYRTKKQKRDFLRFQFGKLGTHYYVAGRFASFGALVPVAGNFLHHAVEMFLKAGLSRRYSIEELKTLRHDLPKIWGQFKAHVARRDVANFDQVINELHRFERIRYPDRVVKEGMEVLFSPLQGGQSSGSLTLPKYNLILEDLDHLVSVILEESSMNPAAYFGILNESSMEALRRENKHLGAISRAVT